MNTLELTEFPDVEIASQIANHKEVWEDSANLISAYADRINKGKVRVKYQQSEVNGTPFGRAYPRPYIHSCVYQWNKVRSTLFGKTEYDVDIKSAHPNFLLNWCEEMAAKNQMSPSAFENLKHYCENREKIVEDFEICPEAIENYNTENQDNVDKKGVVKLLFTLIMFGGRVGTWRRKFGFDRDDYKIPDWFEGFQQDINYICEKVMKEHPKRDLAIAHFRNKHGKDKSICYKKCLSLILQDYEYGVIYETIRYLQNKGFIVTSYNYDGFQILKDERIHEELANISKPNKRIEFLVKPFCKPLDCSPGNLNKIPADYFSSILFHRLGLNLEEIQVDGEKQVMIQPITKLGFKKKKEYFEKYFAYISGANKIIEKCGNATYYHSPSMGKTRFADCRYYDLNKNGEVISYDFIDWWLKRNDKRACSQVQCVPPPLKHPEYVMNLWDGFPIEKVELDETADYQPLLDCIKSVCGHCEKSMEYLLNWFAHRVQFPGTKIGVALVLYSETQGTGKTTIAEGIMKAFCMDRNDMVLITDTAERICGRFSTAGEKVHVVYNEANLSNTCKYTNELKSFLTDEYFERELKGQMSVSVPNIAAVIYTTQKDNALPIEDSDRRHQMFKACSKVANNREFFKKVRNVLNDSKCMRNFYEMLKNRDVSTWDAQADRVKNEVYKDFRTNSRQTIDFFWADYYDKYELKWINDENDMPSFEELPNDDYFKKYASYCEKIKCNNIMKKQGFMRATNSLLKQIIISSGKITTGELRGRRCMKLDMIALKEFSKEVNND
jgi:hypothetical protein